MKKHLVIVFITAVAVASIFQFSSTTLHDDGYFYSKMAQLFWDEGLLADFPWINFGTPHGNFTGIHFFFYILVSPFVKLHPVWGLKAFSALVFGLFSTTFFALLSRRTSTKYAYVGLILLVVSSASFFYRANLNRPLAWAGFLFLLLIWALLNKKLSLLALTCGILVLSYDGFFISAPIVAVYLAVDFFQTRKVDYRALAVFLLAMAAAVLVHPYFPGILTSPHAALVNQWQYRGILDSNEWQPLDFSDPSNVVNLINIVAGLGLAAFFTSRRPNTLESGFYPLLALCSFAAMIFASRFVDFYVPFALLFSVPLIAPYLDKIPWKKIFDRLRQNPLSALSALNLALLLGFFAFFNLAMVTEQLAVQGRADAFRSASEFLRKHSAAGSVVFNTQWDQFPKLFFWNDHNYYVVGLNPVFLFAKSPEHYWQWQHLAQDELLSCERKFCTDQPKSTLKPEKVIKSTFGTRLIFLETERNPKLDRYLSEQARSQTVFDQNGQKIFLLN